ncbi:MAG: hypothetical protein WBY47_12000 [Desulfobacterales bacterium]
MRYHSRRIVRRRAGCRHGRGVNVAARRTGRLANAPHLLPYGRTAHDAIGVKRHPHRLGIDVVEINLNLKYVLFATSFNHHFAEAQRGPMLIQCLAPIHHLPAHCTFIGGAFKGRNISLIPPPS